MSKLKPLIYEFTVSLDGCSYPFWRRFLTSNSINFYRLHLHLQTVLGWRNETPFRFRVGDTIFADPDITFLTLPNEKNARSSKIGKYIGSPGQEFIYEYDPLSKWQHSVVLNEIHQPETVECLLPHCLAGENSRPPENFGGVKKFNLLAAQLVPGMSHLTEIVRFGDHESEHIYDPFHFDRKKTNMTLDYTFNFKAVTSREVDDSGLLD